MERRIILLLLILFLTPCLGRAQNSPQVKVDAGDQELVIKGWLGEESSFISNLRLTALNGEVRGLVFSPSDLKKDDGSQLVGRQNVIPLGDPNLLLNTPKNFQVKVTGIELPGTYKGQVEIFQAGRTKADLVIPITLVARARPNLTPLPGTANLQLRLVQSSKGWLARLLLPKSAFLDKWDLQWANAVEAPVTVLNATVAVKGEQTGYQLTEAALALPQGQQTMPGGQIDTLPLTLKRAAMPPDHYIGTIYLKLEGAKELLKVPVDLSMRVGPFWAAFILALGIVLGRLFKYMQGRGAAQVRSLAAVNQVSARIQKEADPKDQAILLRMVDAVRQLVYREKLEEVPAKLKVIEARLDVLTELRRIEQELQRRKEEAQVKEVLTKIAETRECVVLQQDDEAQKLLKELKEDLLKLQPLMMGEAEGQSVVDRWKLEAYTALDAHGLAMGQPPLQIDRSSLKKLKDSLIFLSGLSDEIRAEATLWLIRPLLYFALLVGLLAVGLNSLYVTNGASFGANPFADYLGLVLWGFSADVASRSLSNLRGGAAG